MTWALKRMAHARKIPWSIACALSMLVMAPIDVQAGQWLGPQQDQKQLLRHADVDQLLAAQPLAAGENIKAVPMFRNARSATVLVQVRDREPLHRHVDSDITVFILRGEGEIVIGEETRPVKAGDVIHVERGVVHAYINRGPQPAAALVVFSPAPGPNDRELVKR